MLHSFHGCFTERAKWAQGLTQGPKEALCSKLMYEVNVKIAFMKVTELS